MTASVSSSTPPPRWFAFAFAALCLLSLAILIATGLDSASRWSFAARCDGRDAVTYYYAAWGLYEGLNPYDRVEILRQLNETPHFVYPIFALPLFLPLVVVDLPLALILFGVAHLAGFVGLIFLWRRLLPVDARSLALLLPIGFGATAVHDLCSSNIVTFETLALWLGIAALWRDRLGRFTAFVAVAAVPKLLWLAMLPLALKRRLAALRLLVAVVAVMIAAFVLWWALWPASFLQWLANLRVTTGIRYNVFTALRDLDLALGGAASGAYADRWEVWVYALWIALVAALVIMVWRRAGIRSLSLLTPLALLVVWPGNLSYSWLPVLPIAAVVIFFLASHGRPATAIFLATLCVLPQPLLERAGLGAAFGQGTFITVAAFFLVLAFLQMREPAAFERWLAGRHP